MTPILDNAALGSDLDCQNLDLLNIREMYPVPSGLLSNDDTRLYDPRTPPSGSVTDESIAETAGIQQSKLALIDDIPPTWLGASSMQAAAGNNAEYLSRKGAPNGYASMDSTGKLLASHVTAGGSPGTVNSVGLQMPTVFQVLGSPIVTSGVLAVSWLNAPDQSWMGINGPDGLSGHLTPSHLTSKVPIELVPPLPATKFITGVFDVERLPAAIGMGTGHAKGVIPDSDGMGNPDDYLGRDMRWHQFNMGHLYQPSALKPVIVLASWTPGFGRVTITFADKKSVLFYRVTNPASLPFITPPFQEAPPGDFALDVNDGFLVEAYTAKEGYNNSDIASYTVVTPISGDS